MTYDCGNPDCVITSEAGKNFEGVIAYAMGTLQTVFDLTAVHRVKLSKTASIKESSSAIRVSKLLQFLKLHEEVEKTPFDQSLLESKWSTLEGILPYFDDAEKLLFRTWIRPTEPTLAEMAFCRVVDGWKFYMEELSGKDYGHHKAVLQAEEVSIDEILNETRNLFVHYGGTIGFNKRKKKMHEEIFQKQLSSLRSGSSRIRELCLHALGLSAGDTLRLGYRETLDYLEDVSHLLEAIEVRRRNES